jgi:hypothetical protein
MSAPTTTTEPATTPTAKATPAKKTTAKTAPAKVPAKTTAAVKAAEAKADDAKLVTHTRTAEVDRLLAAGWSKAALNREAEIAGTTVLWRPDRLTSVDVAKVDALLKRLDEDKVEPPARKTTAASTRTAGPNRTVLLARLAGAEAVLDAAATEKSAAKLREAVASALEIVRGELSQPQDD